MSNIKKAVKFLSDEDVKTIISGLDQEISTYTLMETTQKQVMENASASISASAADDIEDSLRLIEDIDARIESAKKLRDEFIEASGVDFPSSDELCARQQDKGESI